MLMGREHFNNKVSSISGQSPLIHILEVFRKHFKGVIWDIEKMISGDGGAGIERNRMMLLVQE